MTKQSSVKESLLVESEINDALIIKSSLRMWKEIQYYGPNLTEKWKYKSI